jgi:hypothetical protein
MPKVLKLISLEAMDLQTVISDAEQFDELKFIVVLDGRPVKRIGWGQPLKH